MVNQQPKAHAGERRLRTQPPEDPRLAVGPKVVAQDIPQALENLRLAVVAGNILLLNVSEELALIKAAIIGPEAPSDEPGIPVGFIRSVHVETPGTAVQGPNREIPEGYQMVVRQRQHTGARVGYFGFTEGDVSVELTRSEMADGDSLTFSTTRIKNLDNLWFDADTADTFFELIVLI